MTVFPWLLARRPQRPGPVRSRSRGRGRAHPRARTSRAATCWARVVYGAAPTLLGAIVVIVISGVIGHPGRAVRRLLRRPHGRRDHARPRRVAGVPGAAARDPRGRDVRQRARDRRHRAGRHLHPGDGAPRAQRDARPAQPGVRRRGSRARLLRPADHLPPHPAQPRRGHRGPVHASTWRTRSSTSRRCQLPRAGPAAARSRTGARCSPTARSYLLQNPLPAMSAGIAIMLAVIAFNLVGDGLRAQLDPRERER